MTTQSRSTKNGFSLVELMVVVAIIGIIATIAVPSFLKFQAKAKQANAKSELSGVHTAQSAFYATTGKRHLSLPYIGYVPDGVPTDDKNCPIYSSYDSNWPKRFYRIGYNRGSVPRDIEYPDYGEFKCGSQLRDLTNSSIYTEVPKNSLVSAYRNGGFFNMPDYLEAEYGSNLHFCYAKSIIDEDGVCAIGSVNGDLLDSWHLSVGKVLTNFSSGL